MEEVAASFKTLKISRKQNPNQNNNPSQVFHLFLNRPSRGNALSLDFFIEFPKALSFLDQNPDCSVIILSGIGNHFCSGIDLQSLTTIHRESQNSSAKLHRDIIFLQKAITAIEHCRKPVIASIHGACIGGGVDIITACDIRYCTKDAFFSVKEVDLAITADLGSLQRLPGIVGFGNAMELSLTARRFTGSEADELGLVTKAFETKEDLDREVGEICEGISGKPQLAVAGTKRVLLKSRDMSIDQGLDYVAAWNSGALLSGDVVEAVSAHVEKRKPVFSKL